MAERIKGFTKAIGSAGKGVNVAIVRCSHTYRDGFEATKGLRADPRKVTAILPTNDAMAMGVVRVLCEARLKFPGDLAAIGFDDVELARILRPPLITIGQPNCQMGCGAVEILLNRTSRAGLGYPSTG